MIAVTGASGWVGKAVCSALAAKGELVLRLGRKATNRSMRELDLSDHAWETRWPAALSGCDTLVHCAAHVHRAKESLAEQARFDAINRLGTERLLAIADRVGVKRCVLISTMAVYDWTHVGPPKSENCAAQPATAYGLSKLAAEQAVHKFRGDWRIARLATVYGDGDMANFARLASALRRRRFVVPGTGSARKSVLPLDAAGEVIAELALRGGWDGVILNVAAPEAPSLAEICSAFSATCGFPSPVSAPISLLRGAGWIGDVWQNLVGHSPFTSDVLAKLTTSTVVDTSRLDALLPSRRWLPFVESLAPHANYYTRI